MKLIDNAKERILEARDGAIEAVAKAVLERAQSLVPEESGHLKSTAGLRLEEARAIVLYQAHYAPYVHEDERSAGYKWLERAADEIGVKERLAAEFKARL